MNTVSIERETVTPEMAVEWLGSQILNRRLRANVLKRYAQAMQAGEWTDNGEPIRFNQNGTLIDGQHRLTALRDQGLTLDLWIARGLSHEAQATIDTGAKRTVGDVFHMRGIANSRPIAAALNVLNKYWNGQEGNRSAAASVTAPRALELYAEHEAIQGSVQIGRRANASRPALPPALGIALHYMFSLIEEDDANEFFERLTDGVDLPKGSPILALRNVLDRLQKDRQRAGMRGDKVYVQAIVVKAWNDWRTGNTYTSNNRTAPLRWIRTGPRTEAFPRPV